MCEIVVIRRLAWSSTNSKDTLQPERGITQSCGFLLIVLYT